MPPATQPTPRSARSGVNQQAVWVLATAQIVVILTWITTAENWDFHLAAILLLAVALFASASYAISVGHHKKHSQPSHFTEVDSSVDGRIRHEDSLLIDTRNLGDSASKAITKPSLTRSGLHDSTPLCTPPAEFLSTQSQEFPVVSDMIARLHPRTLRWLDSSVAEQEFLGWSVRELRGMSYLDIVHPHHRELAREQLLGSISKGESHGLIYRIRTASGEAKAVEINVGVRYAADGSPGHLRCHVTDVTDRLRASRELRRRTKDLLAANEELRRANRELRELKDLYSDLYQNAPTMHYSLDCSATFRECNKTLLETLGYHREDLIGRPYASILPAWLRPAFAAKFANFLHTGEIEVETRWIKANGEPLDVWVKASAIRNDEGKIVRTRSVAQDITARKSLETQLREKHLVLTRANDELSRKNHELDVFSHVVSHDLQEPLRSLHYFSDLLKKEYGPTLGEAGGQHLQYVIDATKRMRAMVRDLLDLSRAGRATGEFGPIDLAALIEQIRVDFAAAIAARHAEFRSIGPFPAAWGDRDRIAQLLANLVSNGLKYHQGNAPARVSISASSEDGGVIISVSDNGMGIDPRYHRQIFQIFRRLHAQDEFEGTGAGLAICQKIAQAHGGSIWVESEVGQGATFFVRLPGKPDLTVPCGIDDVSTKVEMVAITPS